MQPNAHNLLIDASTVTGTGTGTGTGTDANADANHELYCCFNETRVSAEYQFQIDFEVENHAVISCLSPPSRPGTVDFTITKDECVSPADAISGANANANAQADAHTDRFNFPHTNYEFTIMATVFSISPLLGSENTTVEVIGSGFSNTSDLSCRFHDIAVPAKFVSDSRLVCSSPRVNEMWEGLDTDPLALSASASASASLSVSNNGVDVEGDWAGATFKYTELPVITSIDPMFAPMHGGTTLFVRGNHFRHDEIAAVYCKINDIVVNATLLGNDELACVTPAINDISKDGRLVLVAISIDGGSNFHHNHDVKVLVHYPSKIQSVHPQSVPDIGNSVVKVMGWYFPKSSQLACQFANMTAPARWKSISLVECITPSSIRSGPSKLRISTNGQSSGMSNHVSFMFHDATTLTSMHPKKGPIQGGSTVYIRGTGFSNKPIFVCRFGTVSLPAISVINSTTAACRVPRPLSQDRSNVTVEVSANNGFDYTYRSGVYYSYTRLYQLTDVVPRIGPSSGGTKLALKGDFSHIEMSEMSCRFDEYLTAQSFTSKVLILSDGSIQCTTPEIQQANKDEPITTSLSIVLTGNERVHMTDNVISFLFYPYTNVSRIFPAVGSELGGTNITIFGKFPRSSEVACIFDDIRAPFAHWVNRGCIICTTPPARRDSFLHQPQVELAIALNGFNFESIGSFSYAPVSHISRIDPISGPLSGGTILQIQGEGFMVIDNNNKNEKSSQTALCLIGESIVEATIINCTLAQCQVPPSNLASPVSVHISFDQGHTYITSDWLFTYISSPTIDDIVPSLVPTTEETRVYVYGNNFFSAFMDDHVWLSVGNRTIEGQVINTTTVTFLSPIIESSTSHHLLLSPNGIDYFLSGTMFTILEPPMIRKVTPPFSNEHGGGVILIQGSAFQDTPFLSCKFDLHGEDVFVSATYISPLLVSCITPELQAASIGRIAVELIIFQDSRTCNPKFEITYYPSVTIFSVSPNVVSYSGGSKLKIRGTGFIHQSEVLYCTFVGSDYTRYAYAKAVVMSDDSLECILPSFSMNNKKLAKLTLGAKHENVFYPTTSQIQAQFSLLFHEPIDMEMVSPNVVENTGGAIINVHGQNFVNSTDLMCMFHYEDKRLFEVANFQSSMLVFCAVPRIITVSKRSLTISHLHISNNGKDFTKHGLPVYHRSQFELEGVHPKVHSEGSTTNATFFGNFFFLDSSLKCLFVGGQRSITTKAHFKTSSIVQCLLPATLEPGPYAVSISTMHIHSANDLTLNVSPMINIGHMSPQLGPLYGGTIVSIYGQMFINATGITCAFGSHVVDATFVSVSQIQCKSPHPGVLTLSDINISNAVDLKILYDGVPFYGGKKLQFTYMHLPVIEKLSPVQLSTSSREDTISIQLFGKFLSHKHLGMTVVRVGGLIADIRHTYNDTRIECYIPNKVQSITSKNQVSVEVSSNGGADFSIPSYFTLGGKPQIVSISPSHGMECGGNAVVLSLSGNPFVSRKAKCRFGAVQVEALVVSYNYAKCIAPPAANPGPVQLDFSINGDDWTDKSKFYTYEIPFDVQQVEPQQLSIVGNEIVHVHGANFLLTEKEVFCSFGNAGVKKVLYISQHEITCVSPASLVLGNFLFDIISKDRISMLRKKIPLEFMQKSTSFQFVPKFGGGMIGERREMNSVVNIMIGKHESSLLTKGPLDQDLFCAFEIRGQLYNSTLQRSNNTSFCNTPNIKPLENDTTFLVSSKLGIRSVSNEQLVLSSDGIFMFRKYPSVLDMTPNNGNTMGGTRIQVKFLDNTGIFLNSERSLCQFGSTTVKAIWISTLEVICVSPPNFIMGVNLQISDNGIDYLHVGRFYYNVPPKLKRILPAMPSSFLANVKEPVISIEVAEPIFIKHEYHPIQCLFKTADNKKNKIVSGNLLNSTLLSCKVPPHLDNSGNMQVFLSTNGQQFSEESLLMYKVESQEVQVIKSILPSFGYMPACIKVLTLDPPMIPTNHTHMLLVRGDGFHPTLSLACHFSSDSGVHYSNATYLSRNAIVCRSPSFHHEGIVQLGVSNNGQDHDTGNTSLPLNIIEPPSVLNMSPLNIFAGEAFLIEVNFGAYGSESSCNIGGIHIYPRVLSNRWLECTLPFHMQTQQNALLEIRFDHINLPILNGQKIVSIFGRPIVTKITPSEGLKFQEERVVVKGRNYKTENSVTCHFGDTEKSGYIESDSKIVCNSPVSMNSSLVPFKLQIGSMYANHTQELTYNFLDPWIIAEVRPQSSSTYGKTDIQIFGHGFDPFVAVNCRFGEIKTPAVVMSTTCVKCRTPQYPHPGSVGVQIELSQSENLISSTDNKFFFYPGMEVTNIHPTFGPGGTYIVIHGVWSTFINIILDDDLALLSPSCKFEDEIVTAHFTSLSTITCKTPPSFLFDSSDVDLYTSLNNIEFTKSNFKFHFEDLIEVKSIIPHSGHINGGTIVRVSFFEPHLIYNDGYEKIFCKFGIYDSTYGYFDLSKKTLICQTPAVDGAIKLELLLKFGKSASRWYRTNTFFNFEEDTIILHSAFPKFLNQHGGDLIHIEGEGFVPSRALHCSFIGTSMQPVLAQHVSLNLITCTTPSLVEELVIGGMEQHFILSVSSNLIQYNDVPGFFQFYPAVDTNPVNTMIHQINPLGGPSQGNTTVRVSGTGFISDNIYLCWFGEYATSATMLSNTTIACKSCPLTLTGDKHVQTVDFSITQGSQPLQTSLTMNSSFTYYSTPQPSDMILTPSSIPVGVPSRINIQGTRLVEFLNDVILNMPHDFRARILSKEIKSYILNGEEIIIEFPAGLIESSEQTSNSTLLEVSCNGGIDYETFGVLKLYRHPQLLSLQTSTVIDGYHKKIVIKLSEFVSIEDSVKCQIGNKIVDGQVRSQTLVACPLLKSEELDASLEVNMLVLVSISLNNGHNYSPNTLPLSIQLPPTIIEGHNKIVSEQGDSIVRINGFHFDSLSASAIQTVCIGSVVTIPWDALSCVLFQSIKDNYFTFQAPPGKGVLSVYFQVDTNTFVDTGVMLEYLKHVHINNIHLVHEWPLKDLLVLEIDGNNIDAGLDYSCKVQYHTSSISSYNSSEVHIHEAMSSTLSRGGSLQCLIPSFLQFSSKINVQILRNVDLSLSNLLPFVYHQEVNIINEVQPYIVSEVTRDAIELKGLFLNHDKIQFCIFDIIGGGHQFMPIETHSKSSVQCFIPQHTFNIGISHVSVSKGLNSYHSNSVPFMIRQKCILSGLFPSHGSTAGDTPIVLSFDKELKYNDTWGDLVCIFDNNEVNAYILDPHRVTCRSPHVFIVKRIYLKVGLKKRNQHEPPDYIILHDNINGTLFEYKEPLHISEIFPKHNQLTVGSFVEFSGSPFSDQLSENVIKFISLKNSSNIAMSLHTSRTESGLRVTVPTFLDDIETTLDVSMEISNNGVDFTPLPMLISISPASMQISNFYPIIILENNIPLITVLGSGFGDFPDGKEIYCHIGNEITDSIWVSRTEIKCHVPFSIQPGIYTISLVSNTLLGRESTDFQKVQLIVRPYVGISSVTPGGGPFSGNTSMNIFGSGFTSIVAPIQIDFGGSRVDLVVLNDTFAICHTPSFFKTNAYTLNSRTNEAINVTLSVHSIGQTDSGANNLNHAMFFLGELVGKGIHKYTYYPDEIINSAHPQLIPSYGNTSLKLSGHNFLNDLNLSCKVGNAQARDAILTDKSTIICPIPPADEAFGGSVDKYGLNDGDNLLKSFVSVANNGQHLEIEGGGSSSTMTSIIYYQMPIIKSISQPSFFGRSGLVLAGPLNSTIKMITKNSLPMVETIFCRLGNIDLEVFMVPPQTIICRIVPIGGGSANFSVGLPSTMDIEIGFNGIDFKAIATFTLTDGPIIYDVLPAYGPIVGGNEIILLGSNFDHDSSMLCKFDNKLVPVKFVSEQRVTCIAPPYQNGTVQISIVDANVHAGNEMTTSSISYTFIDIFQISSITPSHGSMEGGTHLTVNGTSFLSMKSLVCVFGTAANISPAYYLSENEISCSVPPNFSSEKQMPRLVTVKIGLKHEMGITLLSNVGELFVYTHPPFISHIYPKRGLIAGGEKILIKGDHFYYPDSLSITTTNNSISCLFGSEISTGKWISGRELECITPLMSYSASERCIQKITFYYMHSSHLACTDDVEFFVGFEGASQKFWNCNMNSTDFEMSLERISTIGDVVVTKDVFYNNKDNIHKIEYYVTFTTLGLPANSGPLPLIDVAIMSPSYGVQSEVRMMKNSCCEVKIATNGIDFVGGMNNTIIPFSFDADVFVQSVYPALGPLSGGTIVTINGTGISDPTATQSLIYCIFGEKYVEATFFDSSSVECIAPQFPHPANVAVTIEILSKAKGVGTRIDSKASFKYVRPSKIISTFPASLPQPWHYPWNELHIRGYEFLPTSSLRCLFERRQKSGDFDNLTVKRFETKTTFHDSQYIECIIPSEYSSLEKWEDGVFVSVTTNGQDWTTQYFVEITEPIKLQSIYPTKGPKEGGSFIHVEGGNFTNVDTLACKFGDTAVKAEYKDSMGIICTSPQHVPGSATIVNITVTENGKHFFGPKKAVQFLYYDNIVITHVSPVVAPSVGGTLVLIQLNSSVNESLDFHCKFNDTQVPALVNKGESTISCLAPPAHAFGGIVYLGVTQNKVDFSEADSQFMYLPGQQTESLKLVPSHGPRCGGTLVQISGYALNHDDWGLTNPKCRFNNIVVKAEETRIKGDMIFCKTPDFQGYHGSNYSASVDISLSGAIEDFTNIGAVFFYDEEISVIKLVPDIGSFEGGTAVQVFGHFPESYQSELLCNFDGSLVPATWQSRLEIRCTSPPLKHVYESHNVTIFSMAWTQEVQSVSLLVDDFLPEVHTISTVGAKSPQGEIQSIEINGIDDQDEIQKITIGSIQSDLCVLDISFLTLKSTTPTNDVFELTFSGYRSDIEVTPPIQTNVSETDLITVLEGIAAVAKESLKVTKTSKDDKDKYSVQFKVTFTPIAAHPLSRLSSTIPGLQPKIEIRATNDATNMKFKMKQYISKKEVQVLEFKLNAGMLTCDDGSATSAFTFFSTSSEGTLKEVLEAVEGAHIKNKKYYGNVAVQKIILGQDIVQMILIFDEFIPEVVNNDSPALLQCDPEKVKVSTLARGVKRKILGGYFQIAFNNHTSDEIPYDASSTDLKQVLETIPAIGSDGVVISKPINVHNGSQTWFVTFIGNSTRGAVPLLNMATNKLEGFNPYIHVDRVNRGSFLVGSYQLKIKNFWSAPIQVQATAKEVKTAIEKIPGAHVSINNMLQHHDKFGSVKFLMVFPHYVGEEPNGTIPITAGNLPQIDIDTKQLTGCSLNISISTIQNGSEPVKFDKGFHLVPPNISVDTLPIENLTRWLHHNESSVTMKEALCATGALPKGTSVSHKGPYENGSFQWQIQYPLGYSSNGETWKVVRIGGAKIQFQDRQHDVKTVLTRKGSKNADGYFYLQFQRGVDKPNEITGKIPVNASATEMKLLLESLPSLTSVNVESVSLDVSQTGCGSKQWNITFTSIREIGDIPLLSVDASHLKGSQARVHILEKVKGTGNTLYVYEVPHNSAFRVSYSNNVTDLFTTKSGGISNDLAKAINSISNKRHMVEVFKGGRESTIDKIFILPLSQNSFGDDDVSMEVYEKCSSSDDQFCYKYTHNGEIWFDGTTSSLGGTIKLGFQFSEENAGKKADQNYQYNNYTGHHITDAISVHATIDEVEQTLKRIDFIDDVEVKKDEDLDLNSQLIAGRIGVNRKYHIIFKNFDMCGKKNTTFDHSSDCNSRGGERRRIPFTLDIDAANVIGTALLTKGISGYDPIKGTSVSVEISLNRGHDFSRSDIMFTYYEQIEVHELYPSHGFHMTKILVKGKNFFQSPDLRCYFSDTVHSPLTQPYFHSNGVLIDQFVNQTHIICSVPPYQHSNTTHVFVSNDGYMTNKIHYSIFTYDKPPKINSIYPSSGPVNGQFRIVVNGGLFKNDDDLLCKFSNTIVRAFYVDSTHIECIAPPRTVGMHALTLSTNGIDFISDIKLIRFYDDVVVTSIHPISGPSSNAGNIVNIIGSNFFNSSNMVCKFDTVIVPAHFRTSQEIRCAVPPLLDKKSGLQWEALTMHRNYDANKSIQSKNLIVDAHNFPLFLSKLVNVEVAMNAQNYTNSGIKYLYQDDIKINILSMTEGPAIGNSPLFISGSGFVNTTKLSCQFGHKIVQASFLTRNLLLCFTPPTSDLTINKMLMHVAVKNVPIAVSNNGVDFSDDHKLFGFCSLPVPSGSFQAGFENTTILKCPKGSYCNGSNHKNFTLCPQGTFQPQEGQNMCNLCDLGFMCPEEGLPVPRLCAAGYVCDVKGTEKAEQPCPNGFFCKAGTATTETYHGNKKETNEISIGISLADTHTTIGLGDQIFGHGNIFGSQGTICFDNSTDDFGLQSSKYPAQVWDEVGVLPRLAASHKQNHSAALIPSRGKFCLPDKYQHMDIKIINTNVVTAYSNVELLRPYPSPTGTYCHPGSSVGNPRKGDFSSPQVCVGTNYCPEGSESPRELHCPAGFYCRFGNKHICPVGSYCPKEGLWDPVLCEPGTFNFMVGQVQCTTCPQGHFCRGYGRIDPELCTPGYVCSKPRLASPNSLCQPGYYCPPGTQTSDPFRNDTTLRPYPCKPGTYCFGGCGFDSVVEGNFTHAQPCSAGFYCEAASTSGKGSGACPPSFICPKGTAIPIPTKEGHYAKYSGTIEAAECLPGFYAPTIESSECIPCPPGTTCEEEGLVKAHFCPPGTYRGALNIDGIPCLTCPQGTWSKSWNLRSQDECIMCASGLSCKNDGMTSPCSKKDLPTPFEPVVNFNGVPMPEYHFRPDRIPNSYTIDECIKLNAGEGSGATANFDNSKSKHHFYFGELVPPFYDILGKNTYN